MNQNFNLDHSKKKFEDIIRNSPAEHAEMLEVLMIQMNILSSNRKEDEKKKDYYMRTGYMLGTLAAVAMSLKPKEVEKCHENSGIVEGLLGIANGEASVLAWSRGTNDLLAGSKVACPSCKENRDAKTEVKAKIIRLRKDGEPSDMDMDDLPPEVKEAIKKIASKF